MYIICIRICTSHLYVYVHDMHMYVYVIYISICTSYAYVYVHHIYVGGPPGVAAP